jgi:hypothetical protein
VVPSGSKVRYELLTGMPCRSPNRPVNVVRRSSAVCAMSGVWLLDRKVPLPLASRGLTLRISLL